jgi:hypothetical protein
MPRDRSAVYVLVLMVALIAGIDALLVTSCMQQLATSLQGALR